MESPKSKGERLPVEGTSDLSDGLGQPLSPVERLAMDLEQSGHQDEADALLELDPLFRYMLKKRGPYTKDGQDLADMLLEALEFWLPVDMKIVDA